MNRTRLTRAALGVALAATLVGCSATTVASTVTTPANAPSPTVATETTDPSSVGAYPVVDTNQATSYNDQTAIPAPTEGQAFYGQDAQVDGNQPSYTVNGDGTVTDDVTGLMWTQTADLNGDGVIDARDKLTYRDAAASASSIDVGGYTDWRLPTIKELYSLIEFSGSDPSAPGGAAPTPFIDTSVFGFGYGDESSGERQIDAQWATSTLYTDASGPPLMFGVNFADGRIKGYPVDALPGGGVGNPGGGEKTFYVFYVRGNPDYGVNAFVDNGDGTVTDDATGLMWAQDDAGTTMAWEDALAWAQQANDEAYLGYTDWRLPNAKELESIVDYSRSPGTTGSAAIDPVFGATAITDEAGRTDYAMYWTSTTHANTRPGHEGSAAVYVAFGRAMGYMNGRWIDVHGAGAQRSDPKTGSASQYPTGHGPQGDAIRVLNEVRLVRDA